MTSSQRNVRCGCRVLIVLRSGGPRVVQRARGFLRQAANSANGHLTVMTNAEVVCVDGVGGVEAVVIRYARTGRLCAVNTPAFLSCVNHLTADPTDAAFLLEHNDEWPIVAAIHATRRDECR